MLNINGGWWSQPSRNQSDSDRTKGLGATDDIQRWAFVKKSPHEQSGLLNPQRLQFCAAWMIGELIECKVPQIPPRNYSWFYRSRLPLRIPLSKPSGCYGACSTLRRPPTARHLPEPATGSSHRTRELWLKTSYFAKESALPARKQDLFSIPQKKNEASILEETRLHHLAEIDDTITAGAKEH
jgi:hypothetical protein